jgi:hypothetical protein
MKPDLIEVALEALKAISTMYSRTWDKEDGGLAMFSDSVDAFEKAHEKVAEAIKRLEAEKASKGGSL